MTKNTLINVQEEKTKDKIREDTLKWKTPYVECDDNTKGL